MKNSKYKFVPQLEPSINREELKQLKRVIKSTYLTESKLTLEFEKLMAEYTGSTFAVTFCNGTAAIYAGLVAMGIGSGDEVIVPDLTFVATANAVILTGAKPVFCDVNSQDFCIDTDHLIQLITDKTKAVIPVYLYGQAPDMTKLLKICEQAGIKILEDAAQGVGVRIEVEKNGLTNNYHAGTIGEIGILSFYGNKTITTGEGGVLLTNNKMIAEKVYRLKNHGRSKKGVFIHEEIGFNFSFTEMQAAIGLAQYKKLRKIQKKKLLIHNLYKKYLKGLVQVKIDEIHNQIDPVYWVSSIQLPNPENLEKFLLNEGIGTRRFFYPLHLQPCYQNTNKIVIPKRSNWISSEIYENSLGLPSSVSIKKSQVRAIAKLIEEFYKPKKNNDDKSNLEAL
jgi:perosamine synthetase